MKISFEQAQRVATRIGEKLGSPAWLLGIGVDFDPDEGFALSVRVAHGQRSRVDLPPRVAGVKIHVVERDGARALSKRAAAD